MLPRGKVNFALEAPGTPAVGLGLVVCRAHQIYEWPLGPGLPGAVTRLAPGKLSDCRVDAAGVASSEEEPGFLKNGENSGKGFVRTSRNRRPGITIPNGMRPYRVLGIFWRPVEVGIP